LQNFECYAAIAIFFRHSKYFPGSEQKKNTVFPGIPGWQKLLIFHGFSTGGSPDNDKMYHTQEAVVWG
jgi:hypothetical protein